MTVRRQMYRFRKELTTLWETARGEAKKVPLPKELRELRTRLDELDDILARPPVHAPVDLPDQIVPNLKMILSKGRRSLAHTIEKYKGRTNNPDILATLEAQVQPLDQLLGQAFLREVKATPMPKLLDYLSPEQVEKIRVSNARTGPRMFDEKFHILQAPSEFFVDLADYRDQCESRNVSLAVAYLDIDDFKQFNQLPGGEPHVDRFVLPEFMRAVEAHIFSHGFAYRYGGDEYVMLLPNVGAPEAIRFLNSLRKKVAAISYRDVDRHTTVSIGVCVVEPDCPLTDAEIEGKANRAKAHAKLQGKNRVASYRDGRLEEEFLYVPEDES